MFCIIFDRNFNFESTHTPTNDRILDLSLNFSKKNPARRVGGIVPFASPPGGGGEVDKKTASPSKRPASPPSSTMLKFA